MAATYHVDISLTLYDIGWHFLNFGEKAHVEGTEAGLCELGLVEFATPCREAGAIVKLHLTKMPGAARAD